MDIILFWISMPACSDHYCILVKDWEKYISDMAFATLVIILIATLIVVSLYAYSARQRRIHSPADLFRPYNCMWWLLFSIAAGVGAAIEAALAFPASAPTPEAVEKVIEQTTRWQESLGTSIGIGLESAFLSFVFAALIILIPGITPKAFKYRPHEWLFPWDRPKRSEN